MFLTEAEILDTPLSLNYTCQYFEKKSKTFLTDVVVKK